RGSIVSTYIYVTGGLVASGEGVEAYDCSMEGEVRGRWTLGGLIGQAFDSSFARCSFAGSLGPGPDSINGSDGGCGGLVGLASNAVFRACSANADIDWNISSGYNAGTGRINSRNFIGEGGAAGVTCGSSAFYDCTAAGTLKAKNGYGGGFVGWTAGAEVFSNCTTTVTLQPDARYVNTIGHGGFASSVASAGALFVDCSVSPRGNNIFGGFYNNQHPRAGVAVGTNTFRRCTVENPALGTDDVTYGFASACWNGVFEGCTVRGGRAGTAGFVGYAGKRPDDDNYGYAQTSTFTDCSVHGTRACHGFVQSANSDGKAGSTNVFRRCRAGCLYGTSNLSGASDSGFGYTLNKGTLVEDCAAYGIADMGDFNGGFASDVSLGTTIRRSVAAVIPRTTDNRTAGFVYNLSSGAVVEDCYAVYGPVSPAVYGNGYYDYQQGYQGGFVRRCRIGQTEGSSPIRRSFALWPVPATTCPYVGSFAAVTPYGNYSTNYFEDCYRPAESPIGDCNDADAEGVEALTAAEFAVATSATLPNYDFANVWHAPNGASSPYLDASVDADTNFWFFAGVIGAEGRILVNGEAPREAYPAGAVLTVEAVPDNPALPFSGWVGEGFADPSAQTTTYTVKNVSAIAAKFCTPIYTVDDWTNRAHATYISEDMTSYALMNDLDFTDYIASNGWSYIDGYYPFAGKLFGQGHTIRGIFWTNTSTRTTYALFNSLSAGAEIRDLTVESSSRPVEPESCNTGYLAGLANQVGSGVLISNCHAVVDWQGVYPESFNNNALQSCQYYGLVASASGADIRIVDCSVEGRLAGGTEACGFIGSARLDGGEIARCAVYADVSTLTNRTGGVAAGFAGSITLDGGAVVRECLVAGVVDAASFASGFADDIQINDGGSVIRDCYSTAEVIGGNGGWSYQGAAGFARAISERNETGGTELANCWFGGTARTRGEESEYNKPYGFAYYKDGDVAFTHCAFVKSDELDMAGTTGVAEIAKGLHLDRDSWDGFDFANVWAIDNYATSPYFPWSLKDGGFRLFAMDEEPGTAISHPGVAEFGVHTPVTANTELPLAVDAWRGAATYLTATLPTADVLGDNHRTLRCTWKAADPPSPDVTQEVTFLGYGGTPDIQGPTNYVVGGKYDPLAPAPVRDDYDFLGWFPLPEGGEAVTTNTTVTPAEMRTFYAQWTPTPKPDLAFRAPPAWPAAAFVATEEGGTAAADEVWTGTIVFLDAAYENAGNGDAAAHAVSATVKNAGGTTVKSWDWDCGALAAGRTAAIADQAFTVPAAPGVYTVTVTLDSGNVLEERSEDNNTFSFTFSAKTLQTVVFEGNGGSPARQERTYTAGAPYGTLPEATRAGYAFAGWWTAAGGGTQVTAGSDATADALRTLHAHWTALPKANLSYLVPDGWPAFAFLAAEEGSLAAVTNVGAGETFFLNVAYGNTGDLDAPEHAVLARLRNSAGAVLTNRLVPCEALAAGASAAVTNVDFLIEEPGDYTFTLALDPEGRVAEGNEGDNVRGFHFQVVLPGIDVAFRAAGGSCATASRRYDFGGGYGWLPTATRTGYAFGGWWTEANGGGTRVTEESAVLPDAATLCAKWTAKKHTVKFNANGGTGKMANQTMTYGTAAKLRSNAFKKSGCVFIGWSKTKTGKVAYKNGQSVKNLRSDTGTITLYAVWAKSKYTVAFNANGGTGTMAKQAMTYNKAAKLRKNAFKRKDCVFIGWAKTKSGKVAYKNAQAVKNLRTDGKTTTLYAKWAKKNYKVAFDANGGKGTMAAQAMTYGKAAKLRKNAFKKSGCVFLGWSRTKTGKVAYKNAQAVKNLLANGKTLTLYAVWAKSSYKVSFDRNGGTGSMSAQAMKYNTAANLKKNAFARTGWTFAGWAKSATGAVAYKDQQSVKNLTANGAVTLYAVWTADGGNDGATATKDGTRAARTTAAEGAVAEGKPAVTASAGDNADAVVDGDGTTAWTPGTADGSWIALSFDEPREIEDVEVTGENLPEGTRFLLSEDADHWEEGVPGTAQYLWILFPADEEPPVVAEIRVAP
ncbi:MAG: InlB B-repeat-containing protein, partial [Kiritimatiellae bacterium]|nr:InlB B-repeat-containing protein [Kiritimatiellia bacterium]